MTNHLADRNALAIALSISLAYDKAMNKDEQQQLKDTLAEVTEALKDETLSEEQRNELETHAAFWK